MMILGIDAGSTGLKIVVMDGETLVLTHYEHNEGDSAAALCRALKNSGADRLPLMRVALTGTNGDHCGADVLGLKLTRCTEIEAIGRGGAFLSGLERALIVNLGTGTTFVLADGKKFTHVGGSGIGGGTLRMLGRRLLGTKNTNALAALAAQGDAANVDLLIGDLFEGLDTLPPVLTAANLAKNNPDATDADWAAGLFNVVMQCAGGMSVLAAQDAGVNDVVLTGALCQHKITERCFDIFINYYPPDYHFVPNPEYVTAIGAALAAKNGGD